MKEKTAHLYVDSYERTLILHILLCLFISLWEYTTSLNCKSVELAQMPYSL